MLYKEYGLSEDRKSYKPTYTKEQLRVLVTLMDDKCTALRQEIWDLQKALKEGATHDSDCSDEATFSDELEYAIQGLEYWHAQHTLAKNIHVVML